MNYYHNGQPINERTALALLTDAADRQGYESENWAAAWDNRKHSEESREFLNEISGYTLEFVTLED